jgi:hypothetical protein
MYDSQKLMELIEELVENGLALGMFDNDDELWQRCAAITNRDPDTGRKL